MAQVWPTELLDRDHRPRRPMADSSDDEFGMLGSHLDKHPAAESKATTITRVAAEASAGAQSPYRNKGGPTSSVRQIYELGKYSGKDFDVSHWRGAWPEDAVGEAGHAAALGSRPEKSRSATGRNNVEHVTSRSQGDWHKAESSGKYNTRDERPEHTAGQRWDPDTEVPMTGSGALTPPQRSPLTSPRSSPPRRGGNAGASAGHPSPSPPPSHRSFKEQVHLSPARTPPAARTSLFREVRRSPSQPPAEAAESAEAPSYSHSASVPTSPLAAYYVEGSQFSGSIQGQPYAMVSTINSTSSNERSATSPHGDNSSRGEDAGALRWVAGKRGLGDDRTPVARVASSRSVQSADDAMGGGRGPGWATREGSSREQHPRGSWAPQGSDSSGSEDDASTGRHERRARMSAAGSAGVRARRDREPALGAERAPSPGPAGVHCGHEQEHRQTPKVPPHSSTSSRVLEGESRGRGSGPGSRHANGHPGLGGFRREHVLSDAGSVRSSKGGDHGGRAPAAPLRLGSFAFDRGPSLPPARFSVLPAGTGKDKSALLAQYLREQVEVSRETSPRAYGGDHLDITGPAEQRDSLHVESERGLRRGPEEGGLGDENERSSVVTSEGSEDAEDPSEPRLQKARAAEAGGRRNGIEGLAPGGDARAHDGRMAPTGGRGPGAVGRRNFRSASLQLPHRWEETNAPASVLPHPQRGGTAEASPQHDAVGKLSWQPAQGAGPGGAASKAYSPGGKGPAAGGGAGAPAEPAQAVVGKLFARMRSMRKGEAADSAAASAAVATAAAGASAAAAAAAPVAAVDASPAQAAQSKFKRWTSFATSSPRPQAAAAAAATSESSDYEKRAAPSTKAAPKASRFLFFKSKKAAQVAATSSAPASVGSQQSDSLGSKGGGPEEQGAGTEVPPPLQARRKTAASADFDREVQAMDFSVDVNGRSPPRSWAGERPGGVAGGGATTRQGLPASLARNAHDGAPPEGRLPSSRLKPSSSAHEHQERHVRDDALLPRGQARSQSAATSPARAREPRREAMTPGALPPASRLAAFEAPAAARQKSPLSRELLDSLVPCSLPHVTPASSHLAPHPAAAPAAGPVPRRGGSSSQATSPAHRLHRSASPGPGGGLPRDFVRSAAGTPNARSASNPRQTRSEKPRAPPTSGAASLPPPGTPQMHAPGGKSTPRGGSSSSLGPFRAPSGLDNSRPGAFRPASSPITFNQNMNILGRPFTDIKSSYIMFEKELGRGRFGVIYTCESRKLGERLACKLISKEKLQSKQDVEDVRREVAVMEKLRGHPSIIHLRDVHEDAQNMYLVMELCEGGELFDRIKERTRYPEAEAARVMRTLLRVLQFCHAKGVMHRDLKPENILLVSPHSATAIKVIDFGVAAYFSPGEKLADIAGSPYYLAPEVLSASYGPEADVWSAGVVLYILLSGLPPFWAPTDDGIFAAIREAKPNLHSGAWGGVSDDAKDLVHRMLNKDPARRLTTEQVLRHRWFQEQLVASRGAEHVVGQ